MSLNNHAGGVNAGVFGIDVTDRDAEFFAETPVLKSIAEFAQARYAARLSVLGCVLRRGLGHVPPTVRLPAITGSQASLNFFTVTTGSSGQGKDVADAAGFEAVTFCTADDGPLPDVRQAGGGTGEGLARIFKGRGDSDAQISVHLTFNEVKKLEAFTNRHGASLEAELLAGYMGQRIGAENNSKDTSTNIEPHSYRLCLGVGCQPENAGFFLDRERNGFPQRFLWLPAGDPWCPRPAPDGRRSEPTGLDVTLPHFGESVREVVVPADIRQQIEYQRWRVLVGDPAIDPLDSHLYLTRLKAAVAIAVLHGDVDITEQYWRLAGHLMARSRQTRDAMNCAVEDAQRRLNRAKAHAQADRAAIVAERLSEQSQQRVVKTIMSKLRRVGWATRRELQRGCDSTIAADFPAVFDLLLDQGILTGAKEEGRTVYRIN